MANFLPLKKSILFCLNKLIEEYGLRSDFLDVGCGVGDVSSFLAEKGWRGKAIDVSGEVLERARQNLANFPSVQLEKKDFFEATGTYNTVLLLDILEHMAEDVKALQKLALLISEDGYAVIVVPSNPRYWQWDDEFYGHVRRYTAEELTKKLGDAGLETIAVWDFTFPVFWLMRWIYLRAAKKPKGPVGENSLEQKTLQSGLKPEWQKSLFVGFLERLSWLWRAVFILQFRFFKNRVRKGHEMILLAKKMENAKTYG